MKKNLTNWLLIILIILIAILLIILVLPSNEDSLPSSQASQTTTTHTHSYGKWMLEEAATCTTKGLMSRSCSCGERDTMILANLGHNFTEWEVVLVPQCEIEGINERTCSTCNIKETQYIEALEHTGDYWTVINYKKHYLCSYCNKSYKIENLKASKGLNVVSGKLVSIGSCSDKEIVVPSTVTVIGKQAFEYDLIESVILPNTVKVIEKNAFNKCLDLNTVFFGDSIISIESKAFFNCKSLVTLTLPSSIKSIEDSAFAYCSSLTSIELGSSINKLGAKAFESCKSLTDIYFDGTIKEWNSIQKGKNWDFGIQDYTVHCSDGDIEK